MRTELNARFALMNSILFICLTLNIFALSCSRPAEVSETQVRVTNLNKSIMCPVCPGESIDQSQNDIAGYMRQIVIDQVGSGYTDEEIRSYFVERYGAVVLMQPPNEGVGRLAWLIPPVGFVIAVLTVYLALSFMRRKKPEIGYNHSYEDFDVELTDDETERYIGLIENEESSGKQKDK